MQKWILIIGAFFLISCKSKNMTNHIAFRLKPGADLKQSLDSVVKANDIKAGWIITCVGSLTDYSIRFANQPNGSKGIGHFEIINLVGTLSTEGSHLHIGIADSTGKTIGGHLMEGCKIYTTAEIVIASSSEFIFNRKEDGTTPWKELQVNNLKNF